MLLHDFIKEVEKAGLSISDGYDLASFISEVPYDKVKNSPWLDLDGAEAAKALERLENGEPAAYITGRREFFGYEFKVSRTVLIPRMETEILVEAALAETGENFRILDLCSGSGCIFLSMLASRADVSGTCVDISREALDTAIENAGRLGLSARANFIEADAASFLAGELFDIVACNPPYVSEEEYEGLDNFVKHEPKLALTAPENGLYFYKNILRNLPLLCKTKGAAFFEIGSSQGSAVTEIAAGFGYAGEILKDLAGRDRVLKIKM